MEEILITVLTKLGVEGGVVTILLSTLGLVAMKVKEAFRTKKIALNVKSIDETQTEAIKKQGEKIELLDELLEKSVIQQGSHVSLLENTIEKQNIVLDRFGDRFEIITKELKKITELSLQNREDNKKPRLIGRLKSSVFIITDDILSNKRLDEELSKLLCSFRSHFISLLESVIINEYEYYRLPKTLNYLYTTFYTTAHGIVTADDLNIEDSSADTFIYEMHEDIGKRIKNEFCAGFQGLINLENGDRFKKFKALCNVTIGDIYNTTLAIYDNTEKNKRQ